MGNNVRNSALKKFVAFVLLIIMISGIVNVSLADGRINYYSKSDFKKNNMINLNIHYFGLIENKCKGSGVTKNSELNFVGWMTIYDIIGDYAYVPSKLDIYKINISNFTVIEPVGDDYSIVAAYRTVYHSSSDNRKFNIQKVSQIIDGTIVRSGEIFSYNDTTGPRGKSQGYKLAPVIKNGEYVDDYGGGVCQVSSTIYAAIFNNPNFKVLTRKPHALTVSYLPEGMDATVSYGGTDFRFRNDYPFDVVLKIIAENGACIVYFTRL